MSGNPDFDVITERYELLPSWLIEETLKKLHPELKEIMEIQSYRGKVFVAGGVIRSTYEGGVPADIDVFTTDNSVETAIKHELCLRKHVTKKRGIYTTDHALTLQQYSPAIQLISRWHFRSPVKVSEAFDFTCCTAVMWVRPNGDWAGIADVNFEDDIGKRLLRWTNPKDAEIGGTLLRVLKYSRKGYNIIPEEFAKILAAYNKATASEFWKKTGGDCACHLLENPTEMAKLMREVDPLPPTQPEEPVDDPAF